MTRRIARNAQENSVDVTSSELTAALDRMPHRPPMRLLSRLVSADREIYEAEAVIDANNIFLSPEGLERVALVEMLAQTFAAGSALNEEGAPRIGYLVGMRDVHFHGDARCGDTLRIRAWLESSLLPFVLVMGEVRKQLPDTSEELLMEGQIRLFLPPEGSHA